VWPALIEVTHRIPTSVQRHDICRRLWMDGWGLGLLPWYSESFKKTITRYLARLLSCHFAVLLDGWKRLQAQNAIWQLNPARVLGWRSMVSRGTHLKAKMCCRACRVWVEDVDFVERHEMEPSISCIECPECLYLEQVHQSNHGSIRT